MKIRVVYTSFGMEWTKEVPGAAEAADTVKTVIAQGIASRTNVSVRVEYVNGNENADAS